MSTTAMQSDSVVMDLDQYKSVVFLTSGICDETGHVGEEQLKSAGLGCQSFKDSFYPLTEEEELFIADRFEYLDDRNRFGALMGYSALIDSQKYFVPTIEVGYTDESPFAYDRDEAYEHNQKSLKIARAIASVTGGKVMWSEDAAEVSDERSGRFVTEIYIPVSYVVGTFPGYPIA